MGRSRNSFTSGMVLKGWIGIVQTRKDRKKDQS